MLNEALSIAIKRQYVGLPITEATASAVQAGLQVVTVQHGMPTKLTNEFRQDRVTFFVKEDKVVSFRIG